jgi:uncharacterized protein
MRVWRAGAATLGGQANVAIEQEIEREAAHRPWPLPAGPWTMYQRWMDVLFAHWDLPPEHVRPLVPPPLVLDLYEGRSYVGITPLRIAGLRVRGLPPLPGASDFQELNLRTYVRHGDRAGVFFFSLDAASGAAVLGARAWYRLPYHRARMELEMDGEWIEYRSRRGEDEAVFEARYRPTGPARPPEPGSRDHFLTERYALFAASGPGRMLTADIHHRPWLLQPAAAEIRRNTVADAAGLELPGGLPLLLYAASQDALIWPPADLAG